MRAEKTDLLSGPSTVATHEWSHAEPIKMSARPFPGCCRETSLHRVGNPQNNRSQIASPQFNPNSEVGEHARPGRGWARGRVQHVGATFVFRPGGHLHAARDLREGAENSARVEHKTGERRPALGVVPPTGGPLGLELAGGTPASSRPKRRVPVSQDSSRVGLPLGAERLLKRLLPGGSNRTPKLAARERKEHRDGRGDPAPE